MNTKLTAWVIIGIIIVGGGWYAFSQQHILAPMQESLEATSEEVVEQDETAGTFIGSLADLSMRGGSWQCDVDTSAITGAGAMSAQGTVYVSGKKVRADFAIEAPIVGTVHTYMIADGTDVYSWSSMMPSGIKAPMQQPEGAGDTPTQDEQTGPYNSYAYDCMPAQVDASLFVIPSDITFQTVTP